MTHMGILKGREEGEQGVALASPGF